MSCFNLRVTFVQRLKLATCLVLSTPFRSFINDSESFHAPNKEEKAKRLQLRFKTSQSEAIMSQYI